MDVTQRGATTTVKVEDRVFKITYNTKKRRLEVREDGRMISNPLSFQNALAIIDMWAKRPKYYTGE